MKKYDALIFDLDGTLWDSSETVCRSWNEVIKVKNCPCDLIVPDELKKLMGRPMIDFVRKFFPFAVTESQQNEIFSLCSAFELEHIAKYGGKLYENVEETLKALSEKYPLFIVSNCQDGYIEAFLEYFGFAKYFTDTLCPGAGETTKAENIMKICEKHGCKAAAYIGDTVTDCVSSREAGVDFIFASYGFGQTEDYDAKLSGFQELCPLLL